METVSPIDGITARPSQTRINSTPTLTNGAMLAMRMTTMTAVGTPKISIRLKGVSKWANTSASV
jgi:hypothetical protein